MVGAMEGAVGGSWAALRSGGAATNVDTREVLPLLSSPSTGMYAADGVVGLSVCQATGSPPNRANARSSAQLKQPRMVGVGDGGDERQGGQVRRV
jgi:hypothetical protein